MADVHLAMSSRPQSERVHLGAPALTSDGSLAVLAVSFPGNIGHLVIYNIDRSKYRIIEKPDDEAWISPSFSRDGDKVAFIRYCATCDSRGFQVASYNIRTNQVTTLTQGEDLYRGNPIYSPSGRFIAYNSRNIRWNGTQYKDSGFATLHMLTLSTKLEREIDLEKFGLNGFLLARLSGFIDEDTIVFQAMGPYVHERGDRGDMFRRLKDMVGDQRARTTWYGYRLEFDDDLEFLRLDSGDKLRSTSGLTVSEDRCLMVFIDRSDRTLSEDGFYKYDIFLYDGRTIGRLTSINGHMAHTFLSRSGNRIAFLADSSRQKRWSLWMLEVESGRVWETDLRRQMEDRRRR